MKVSTQRIVRLVVVGVSSILTVNTSRSIWDLWRRRDILSERQAVLGRLETEHKRLQSDLEYAQSPEFIEQEARNRLGLAREGEAVVLLPNDQPARPAGGFPISNFQKKTKEEKIPNWKKWWRLFF